MTQATRKEPVQLPIYDRGARRIWFDVMRTVAILTACFCVFIAARMVLTVARDWSRSPLVAADVAGRSNSDPVIVEFQRLKTELVARPEDETIKERIRQIDHELRGRYFSHHATLMRGAYLLAGGLIVLVLAVKASTQWGAIGPGVMTMFGAAGDCNGETTWMRLAIMAGGGILIAGMVMWRTEPVPSFAVKPAAALPATATAPAGPTLAEIMANWASFRGPASGVAMVDTAPTTWDGATGRNIAWKTEVPLEGHGSPIVWGGKVFLAGASVDAQEVYCFGAATGKLAWRGAVTGPVKAAELTINEDAGYAPATMATDGQRVYAMFPTGDLAAFDFAGQLKWSKNLGKPDSSYGLAASLATYRDRVIVQLDQGDAKSGKSALLAFDGASGAQVWKTRRNLPNSWASPLVIYPGGDLAKAQIITCGNPLVVAYSAESGQELWNAKVLGGDVAASPAFANGTVFVANDQAIAAAIKIGGTGDVTKSQVLWTAEDGLPEMVSPLATEDIVLLVYGQTASCYDAKNGAKLWEHDLEGSFHASPILVGKTIYLVDTKGVTHLFEAGREYRELGTAALGEEAVATPAIVRTSEGVRIFIRGKKNLYCIKGEEGGH